ncbi:MAG: hypothetical protein AAGC96_03095 [Pseudomonadota bacterium]
MRQSFKLIPLVAVVATLSACVSSTGPRYNPNSVEGEWLDSNGIRSTFNAGQFQTRTTDTNTLLATGRYTNLNPRLVQIEMRSLVRNTNSTVNCSLVSPTQLNCTSSSGSQFSLNRPLA